MNLSITWQAEITEIGDEEPLDGGSASFVVDEEVATWTGMSTIELPPCEDASFVKCRMLGVILIVFQNFLLVVM